ncbi:unnamed protein product [Cunninghamella blakesleeana]
MRSLFTNIAFQEPVVYNSSFTKKFCGIMSLRAGCSIACLIWVGIGLYGSILAFQYQSPIFSYIIGGALLAQGVACLVLTIAAGAGLFGLYAESLFVLNRAHKGVWLAVFFFLLDFFITIIFYGIQQQQNAISCYDDSKESVNELVSFNNNNNITFTIPPYNDYYNCNKIWQDEMKFAIAIFIVFLIFFVYWAWCLWAFTQKLRMLKDADYFSNEDFQYRQQYLNQLRNQAVMGPHPMPSFPPNYMYNNLAPPNTSSNDYYYPQQNDMHQQHHPNDLKHMNLSSGGGDHGDGHQRSMAEITRDWFSKMKS